MKSGFWLPAVVLCMSTMLVAQQVSGTPAVIADRPTIVVFSPNASKIGSDDTALLFLTDADPFTLPKRCFGSLNKNK
jgi:hypothetical protein